MSTHYAKLRALLQELFQLDQADLDFGIYRIMNAKRDEITRFLDNDLLPQVQTELANCRSAEQSEAEIELQKLEANAREMGIEPDNVPKIVELRARVASGVDVAALESDVYSHLYNFFRRYYSNGDFLSLRRYKEGVYAIPYEGEEVKLHWANADQYYVKSSETLRDYTFRAGALPNGVQAGSADDNRMRVHFKLADATTQSNNNKAAAGKDSRFIILDEEGAPISLENDELVIHFQFKPDEDSRKQAKINESTAEKLNRVLEDAKYSEWANALRVLVPTEANRNRTLLEKHLADYTARNTSDYFIHKDLGGFLRRELDFFLKNEVMHLDDIENESAPRVEAYLTQLKAIRRIAHKISDFLAQIENFQKKLWLKKKFVVGSGWCVTLDRVPQELYDEICENAAQREEWLRLFAIDEIEANLQQIEYSIPLKPEFLRAQPHLVLDTKFFDDKFVDRLLASFDDLDAATDGILFHSENFQALNLMQTRFREQIKCTYIDPPYNTGNDGFSYKDSYQHSSWLSMMENRLILNKAIMSNDGNFICHIDENEFWALTSLVDIMFGADGNIGPIIWDKRNPKGDSRGIARQNEEILWAVTNPNLLKTEQGRLRQKKKNAEQILRKAENLILRNAGIPEKTRQEFRVWLSKQNFSEGEKAYNQIDAKGKVIQSVSMAWPNKKKAPENYFIPLIHPITSAPCVVPERGWRNPPETMSELLSKDLIIFGLDETTQPRRKYLLEENLWENVPSMLSYGGSDDELFTNLDLHFSDYPKPLAVSLHLASIGSNSNSIILDYFAGSGTTGHAVINLNREDGGTRKYILVEMGEYFDTVLKPRLQKAIYSKDWRDGKPVSRVGSSHLLHYLRLESYEDTLNNLQLQRLPQQQQLLEEHAPLREDYTLRYMLDIESRESASLLPVSAFAQPFSQQLQIAKGNADETRATKIDLIETFNWLLGLRVLWREWRGAVYVVQGTTRDGNRVLVLWRDLETMPSAQLDKWFGDKQSFSTRDTEFDLIYVNGDNNLQNLRRDDESWKVRLIEEEFARLMWDTQNA